MRTAKQIFLEAIEHYAPDEWSAYLDRTCGAHAELRRRVEILLDAHAADESLLDEPAVAATDERPAGGDLSHVLIALLVVLLGCPEIAAGVGGRLCRAPLAAPFESGRDQLDVPIRKLCGPSRRPTVLNRDRLELP